MDELTDASLSVAERVTPAYAGVNSMEYSKGALSPTVTAISLNAVPLALDAPTLKVKTPPAVGVPDTSPVAEFTLIQEGDSPREKLVGPLVAEIW